MSTKIGQETRESLHNFVDALRRDRQRLRVQINLGNKELHEDWNRMEQKWVEVEHHLSELTDDSIKHVHTVGDEIAASYHRAKERLGISDKAS